MTEKVVAETVAAAIADALVGEMPAAIADALVEGVIDNAAGALGAAKVVNGAAPVRANAGRDVTLIGAA